MHFLENKESFIWNVTQSFKEETRKRWISLRIPLIGISSEQRKIPKDEVPEEHVLLVHHLKPAGDHSVSTYKNPVLYLQNIINDFSEK